MTINIPLKAVAFVLYTLALLGGAFGISYAVFEWRHDDETSVSNSAPARTGPTQAELDAQLCGAALEALGNAIPAEGDGRGLVTGGGVPVQLREAVNKYCELL